MTFKYSLLSLLIVSLMGCTTNSEIDYSEQASIAGKQTASELMNAYIDQALPKQSKWVSITELMSIPELDSYIQAALSHNPSLQQSVTALKILYAQKGVADASRLPMVNASYSANGKEDSDESYTGDVTVSWELDIWNRLGNSSNAAEKDISSELANLQAAKDLIVANVMRSWLEVSRYQQLVEIEQRRLAVLTNNESLVLQRYQVGLGSLQDLDDAKTTSATTRSTLAEYKENLEKSKRSLVLLTGKWSSDSHKFQTPSTFPDVLNPIDQLSEQTLERRPDIQKALYSIEAESLRTQAAYKAMLPSISLSASLTSISESPSDALLVSPLWSMLGKISAPLFQGGKLKAEAEIAELTTERAFWVYQDTLLTAVNEVENAVGLEYSLHQQQSHLREAFDSATRSSENYREKYRQGLVDILDLLTVQQKTYDTQAQLVNTTYERLVNRIDLGLALGLGYKA